jgi:hypothetical protein
MHSHLRGAALAPVLVTIVAGLWLAAAQTTGQNNAYRPPRTASGKPDLNGIWQALNTANYDIEAHAARPALAVAPGPAGPIPALSVVALGAVGAVPPGLGVVEGEGLPYQPWAATKKRENAQNWLEADPEIKCYLPGVPRATYLPFPFQIVQSADVILIAYEYASATRIIYINGASEAPVDSWMGHSNGRWDGDTLVVDVTGLNDQTWFDRAGNFHSNALHVVERYTRISGDTMWYEATIEDPKVFTRPWKMSMPLYRRLEKNMQLLEFKCVEFVEELMDGHLRRNAN